MDERLDDVAPPGRGQVGAVAAAERGLEELEQRPVGVDGRDHRLGGDALAPLEDDAGDPAPGCLDALDGGRAPDGAAELFETEQEGVGEGLSALREWLGGPESVACTGITTRGDWIGTAALL